MALAAARLRAPTVNPPAIWAAAANYRAHQAEMVERVGSYDRTAFSSDDLAAELFLKPVSSIIGPGGTVILPKIANHVDFECEPAARSSAAPRARSRPSRRSTSSTATPCAGTSASATRGARAGTTRATSARDSTPSAALGPWIVTRDEIREPQDLMIVVEQNGAVVMRAHTADMINGLRDLIRFLSSVSTLQPGTLLTTGRLPASRSSLRAIV